MGLIVLDAGVVAAVLDPADIHHAASLDALRESQRRGDLFLLPASAYAECLVWPLRAGDASALTADSFIDTLPATVVAADRAIARTAAGLRARHGRSLRLPDALVIATAIETDASAILTTDQGWPDVGVSVRVVSAMRG